jgi:hypothetical protein
MLAYSKAIQVTDNELKILVAGLLEEAVAASGWTYPVIQKNQPHQEGMPEGPSVFFEKLFSTQYGFAKSDYSYVPAEDVFKEKESQWFQTTFQISSFIQEDPKDITLPTAADITERLRMLIGSRATVRKLKIANVGMYRVTEVRNPYFEDDKLRFEAYPSFDIVLTHIRSIENDIGVVRSAEIEVYPVP